VWQDAGMGAVRIALVVVVSLLAASCGRPNQFAEITMHDGTVLTVLEPQAYYQAVCDPGTTYRTDGEPDADALRAVHAGVDATKWENGGMGPYDEIKWTDIDSIVFGKGLGDLGDATHDCSGTPLNVAATIRFKGGRVAQRALADTTDLGIEGLTERGPAIVPIRDIAQLRMAEGDRDWVGAQQNTDMSATTLHIVRRDGSRVTVGDPEIIVPVERLSVLGVTQHRIYGLPALAGGARLEIRWPFIASVKISGDANALWGDIVYTDGHRERIALADGEMSGNGIAEADPLKLHSIGDITVTTR
jgi:hypothetical protein